MLYITLLFYYKALSQLTTDHNVKQSPEPFCFSGGLTWIYFIGYKTRVLSHASLATTSSRMCWSNFSYKCRLTKF